jgi:hypothetical protein
MFSAAHVLAFSILTMLAIVPDTTANATNDRFMLPIDQTINFETIGGITGDDSLSTCWKNMFLLNRTISSLQSGDTLIISANRTFWLMGGIYARSLSNVTIQIDGNFVIIIWNGLVILKLIKFSNVFILNN